MVSPAHRACECLGWQCSNYRQVAYKATRPQDMRTQREESELLIPCGHLRVPENQKHELSITHKSHECLPTWRGCFDANFISIPCFPLTPILTYVQAHFLPIQSEHNASTVREVRSACVPFVSSVRPQCTKIRMRVGRPSGHPCFWLPPFVHYLQCSSSRSINISNHHALSCHLIPLTPPPPPPRTNCSTLPLATGRSHGPYYAHQFLSSCT